MFVMVKKIAAVPEESVFAALERREALFEDVVRRVHEPGVDVAELLQREEVRAVLGVVEVVRRRPVHRNGAGERVRLGLLLPSMDRKRLQMKFAHISRSPIQTAK